MKAPKVRSVEALNAWNRKGAGQHTDRKRKANREACRGRQSGDEQ